MKNFFKAAALAGASLALANTPVAAQQIGSPEIEATECLDNLKSGIVKDNGQGFFAQSESGNTFCFKDGEFTVVDGSALEVGSFFMKKSGYGFSIETSEGSAYGFNSDSLGERVVIEDKKGMNQVQMSLQTFTSRSSPLSKLHKTLKN